MKRREFIAGLGGAAAWPIVVRAQQAMPVIGWLGSGSRESDGFRVTAFRQGLHEAGYVEGQNVAIEYRWAEGQYDRLAAQAGDLVNLRVAAIVTAGTASTLAAKAVTSTIPIVFNIGVDPVQFGLVASFNRPGGNATGVLVLSTELVAKRLELLHELLPTATAFAFLLNPANPAVNEAETRATQDVARSLGLQLHFLRASTVSEIDAAFGTLVELRADGLVVSVDPFLTNQRAQIAALAAHHLVPAILGWREFPEAGGLMSYGVSLIDAYRLHGVYAGKILKGAKPTDLPVQQAVKFELVINLKTAKALGLDVPPSLLARADEVIE
jgi:putative tryptophan/tyrosine transport system substrate-binding protein